MTTPTLVLGLGGFGASVAVEVKKSLEKMASFSRVPTAFLVIDQSKPLGDPGNVLGAEEWLHLPSRKATEILEQLGLNEEGRSGWRDLLPWFPEGKSFQLIDALEPSGARRYRPLGRLGLFAADESVERSIKRGIFRARCASPAPDPETSMRVALVTSLGGGSGSGMLLDVAHLTRRLDGTAFILGYFALPGAFSDHDFSNRLEANTYAALQEITALRAGNIEFEAQFERIPSIRAAVSRRELFARSFLFGEVERCDALGDIVRRTARAIVAQLDTQVQRATICAVQGMARLADEETRRVLAPEAFGAAAARWLFREDFSALELQETEASLAQGMPQGTSRTDTGSAPQTNKEDPTDARAPAETVADPTHEVRWRLAVRRETDELGSAIQGEIQKRLRGLGARFREIRFATEGDVRELSGLEDIIVISGTGSTQKWSVDPEALATHEAFRAIGAKERIRKASEDFLKLPIEADLPLGNSPAPPESNSAAMLQLLAHWEALRRATARQPSLWARFWRAISLGSRRPLPLEERCNAFNNVVDRSEFRDGLHSALENYARALRDQERGVSSVRVSSEEAGSGSSQAPGSSEKDPETVPGYEIPKATSRVVRWEEYLLQVVRGLRESVFGDPEPRPRRRAFLLALVPQDFPWPTGFLGLKNALESAADELGARCLVERYSGDRLWLVAEDLFNSADHVRLLEGYKKAYENDNGEPKELYHLDRRWVEKLGLPKRPSS